MKSIFLTAIVFALLSACSGKLESQSEAQDEWPALDAFHMVIAEAYHPLKDSSNLAPAKAMADELALEAGKWASAALPERINNDRMKERLDHLNLTAQAFASSVKTGASDEELASSLEKLHDEFHSIMETWYEKDK